MVLKTGTTISIFVIIDILLIAGAIIWAVIIMRKIKAIPDFPRHTLVVIYGLKKFVDGNVIGFLDKVRKHPSGRYLVDYYPMDYSSTELEKLEEIPKKTVISEHIHVSPKDKHSNGFNIMYVLPKHESEVMTEIEELPASFQKGFMNTTMKDRLEGVFFKGVREGDDALESMVVEVSKGQLSREAFLKIKEIYETERKEKSRQTQGTEKKDEGTP